MKHIALRSLLITASFSALPLTFSPLAAEPVVVAGTGARVVNGIAATVNGLVVTQKEVAILMAPIVGQLTAQFPRRGSEFEKKVKEAHDKILDELIDRELVMSEFKHIGGKLRPEAINEEIDRQINTDYNGNKTKFRDELSKARLTMASYREMTERKMIVQAMRASKFNDVAPPLPHEIQQEYNTVKLSLRDINGDKITFQKIYIPAVDPKSPGSSPDTQLALAEDLVKQIKEGGSLEELAKKHSRDAYAEKGGRQDLVPRTDLAPEFANLIMDPPEGTIIGPLMDPRGLTIVKVISKSYGPVPPLSKVHAQIEQRVSRQKTAERYDRWIKNLRAKALISKKN
jgi:peptidyl-prolyl cis-trans isomerase SurA